MEAVLETAGERVAISCPLTWLGDVLTEGCAGELVAGGERGGVDAEVTVEASSAPFDTNGWETLTRDAWRDKDRLVLRDACSSGLDVELRATGRLLVVRARWRPQLSGRAASMVLRTRSRLLLRAVLLQYPALWWAGAKGRAPLHASVCGPLHPSGHTVIVAGPGGVGKSTMVQAELALGSVATSDNLCTSDGTTTWGVVEPRRLPAGSPGPADDPPGRRTTHGRRESGWSRRALSLQPNVVVVLRRDCNDEVTIKALNPDEAARALVAGTYMAGELRRYWGFAAAASLATGIGDPHPPVDAVARQLASRLPCIEVTLAALPAGRLGTLLDAPVAAGVAS